MRSRVRHSIFYRARVQHVVRDCFRNLCGRLPTASGRPTHTGRRTRRRLHKVLRRLAPGVRREVPSRQRHVQGGPGRLLPVIQLSPPRTKARRPTTPRPIPFPFSLSSFPEINNKHNLIPKLVIQRCAPRPILPHGRRPVDVAALERAGRRGPARRALDAALLLLAAF